MSSLDPTAYDTLSFDCYGTLIDWESGIIGALGPLLARNRSDLSRSELLAAFAHNETRIQQAAARAPYPKVLREVHRAVAGAYGFKTTAELDAAFGDSVGDWPAFPDSSDALARLATKYRLVILSNVDRQSFARTQQKLGVTFDAVYTAEAIGSYKPDPANFEYLLRHEAGRLLHVAQSLYHDHAPAKAAGMSTVWIDRNQGGAGATPPAPQVSYDLRLASMAEFAEAAGV